MYYNSDVLLFQQLLIFFILTLQSRDYATSMIIEVVFSVLSTTSISSLRTGITLSVHISKTHYTTTSFLFVMDSGWRFHCVLLTLAHDADWYSCDDQQLHFFIFWSFFVLFTVALQHWWCRGMKCKASCSCLCSYVIWDTECCTVDVYYVIPSKMTCHGVVPILLQCGARCCQKTHQTEGSGVIGVFWKMRKVTTAEKTEACLQLETLPTAAKTS